MGEMGIKFILKATDYNGCLQNNGNTVKFIKCLNLNAQP